MTAAIKQRSRDNKKNISVIIPALNEEENIRACIESAKSLNPCEIIVVDGGSHDRTLEIAKSEGVIVIQSPKGRGIQMNAGASLAKGGMLLFLHADSVLSCHSRANGNPEVVFEEILDSCFRRNDKKNYVGGFFRLRFDDKSFSARLVEVFANMRSRIFSLPYGDQAIFVKKDIFERMGGFKEYPFLEDIDFVIRLRKFGKLRGIPSHVMASSRRIKRGYPLSPIFISLRNVFITLLFLSGVSPQRLIALYK